MVFLKRQPTLLPGILATVLLIAGFIATSLFLSPVRSYTVLAAVHASQLKQAAQAYYQQVNLVSDQAGKANFTDSNMVNPWGIAYPPTGPFWVSDASKGVSTLYDSKGTPLPLVVSVPGHNTPKGAPTGQVFNSSKGFAIKKGGKSGPSLFIFDTLDGTISGWNSKVDATHAITAVDESATHAVYTGLAIAQNRLYAANFGTGQIEVFDVNFHKSTSFTDPKLPKGYAPFNVQTIGDRLYVAFASLHDGMGHGYVDTFSFGGQLTRRLITQSVLNSPWGLAIAPASFGKFGKALLVGNLGDGHINAFNPSSGAFLGSLSDKAGKPIVLERLWALIFGNGGRGGDRNTLYFTAGVGKEKHGLFGAIQVASAPKTQTVTITTDNAGNFTFSPTSLTIPVGTTVTWKNTTQAPHTATSDDNTSFDSMIINPGDSFSFTFNKKGTFPYHCNIHSFMKATITVK